MPNATDNPPGRYKYLQPEELRKLANFRFAPRLLVEGYLAGRHRTRIRGSSTEFRDYRQYVPGDDPRTVDWRVVARSDRHFVRTFEQETSLACHLFLDSSASMGFGEPVSKLEYASFFAAALSFLVTHQGDRVSLLLFDASLREFHPPGGTRQHLDRLMHALENNRPGARTSLAATLRKAAPLLPRRGSLIVVSDFLDDAPAIMEALNPYVHRGFAIHLLQLLTPGELNLEDHGLAAYVDMEDGRRVVAHPADIGPAYAAAMQRHIDALRELAARRRICHTLATTRTPFFELFDMLS